MFHTSILLAFDVDKDVECGGFEIWALIYAICTIFSVRQLLHLIFFLPLQIEDIWGISF